MKEIGLLKLTILYNKYFYSDLYCFFLPITIENLKTIFFVQENYSEPAIFFMREIDRS